MASNLQHIQPGTNVYASDGDKIGDVSEVGVNYVLVRQGWLFTTDRYIPLAAIAGVDADGIYVNVAKDQIEHMGWDVMPEEGATTATYGTTTSTVRDTSDTMASTVRDTSVRRDETAMQPHARDVDAGAEVAIPVVEEELRAGKRAVEGGGVRVTTRVEETPVEEQVTLREERVDVERRAVDRPVSDADLAALQDGTVEVRARREEPVVDKQARIVEEVVIKKDVDQRTETIHDTVRRTDVNVEEIPGQTRTSGSAETGYTRGGTEGVIEQGLSQAENATERRTGLDLDRDRDLGQRDPRNNY